MDSRPPMAIFELLDYIVNEVSTAWLPWPQYLLLLRKDSVILGSLCVVPTVGRLCSCGDFCRAPRSWNRVPGLEAAGLPREHLWVARSFSSSFRFRSLQCAHYILTPSFTKHFLCIYCGLRVHCGVELGTGWGLQTGKQKSLVVKTIRFIWEARVSPHIPAV